MKNLALWLKGFAAAVLGGAVAGVAGNLAAPEQINTKEGRTGLAIVAGVGAIKAASAYLMDSPKSKRRGNEERRKR